MAGPGSDSASAKAGLELGFNGLVLLQLVGHRLGRYGGTLRAVARRLDNLATQASASGFGAAICGGGGRWHARRNQRRGSPIQ